MNMTEVEDRVRRMHRAEPSADLRTRVLSGEPVAERPVTWTARVASPGAGAPPLELMQQTREARHGWRRSGVPVALGILLIVGSCAGFDVMEGHRLEAEIARIEAKYGSLDLSTLNVPAVPDADNRARVVRAAAALTVTPPGSTYFYVAFDFHGSAPVRPNLRAFAESNRDAIRVAGDVLTRRQSNWEIDYRTRTERLPYEPVRILSDAISLTALLDLEAGRADDATRMVVTGLGVSASLRQEPHLLAQFVRSSGSVRLIGTIREILTRSAPSPGALAELASWLAENRMADPLRMSVLSDLKHNNAVLARMENGDIDPDVAADLYPQTWPSWPKVLMGPAARIGRPFVRQARVRALQYYDQALDLLASPSPHISMPELPRPQRWDLVDRLTSKLVYGIWRETDFFDDFLSELGAAEVAVALRRFKLDGGTYPDDLSVLAPRYLADIPIDPYTGRPPVYMRQDDGFTLRTTVAGPPPQWGEWKVVK